MLTKFSSLPIGKRLGILIALAAGIAGLVAATMWTQQPEMQVLFANLAPGSRGGELELDGVPQQVRFVPLDDFGDAALDGGGHHVLLEGRSRASRSGGSR